MKKGLQMVSVVLLMLSMLAIGCPAQPVDPEPVLGPRYGGTLVVAVPTEPPSLDPTVQTCSPSLMVSMHINETLFYQTVEGEIVPALAVDYSVCPDGLVWTIYLREGVKFHDGTPFNAQAVKYNIDRFLTKPARFRFLLAKIAEVNVVDDYTIELRTYEPFAPLRAHLAVGVTAILSPAAIEKYGDAIGHNPVGGTGPFRFVEWARGDRIVLAANEDYWGGRPYVDELIFEFVVEDAARLAMLAAGEAHVVFRVPAADVPWLEADPTINVSHVPGVRTMYIAFNYQREPFTDVRVRHALNYAVNKEEIVEYVLGGAGRVSDAPMVPEVFGYARQTPFEFNPERARELLAEAGFPDGFSFTLHHPTGRYVMDAAIAEAVQAQLREVGVEAELVTKEWATYLGFLRTPLDESTMESFMLGWGSITLDADFSLFSLFHSGEWTPVGRNRFFYKNEEVDRLLEAARTIIDPTARLEMYERAIELIWQDAPWIFLHSESQINAERANVRGVIHHPGETIFLWDAWIED